MNKCKQTHTTQHNITAVVKKLDPAQRDSRSKVRTNVEGITISSPNILIESKATCKYRGLSLQHVKIKQSFHSTLTDAVNLYISLGTDRGLWNLIIHWWPLKRMGRFLIPACLTRCKIRRRVLIDRTDVMGSAPIKTLWSSLYQLCFGKTNQD